MKTSIMMSISVLFLALGSLPAFAQDAVFTSFDCTPILCLATAATPQTTYTASVELQATCSTGLAIHKTVYAILTNCSAPGYIPQATAEPVQTIESTETCPPEAYYVDFAVFTGKIYNSTKTGGMGDGLLYLENTDYGCDGTVDPVMTLGIPPACSNVSIN